MNANEFQAQIESYAKYFVSKKPADPAKLEEITGFLDKEYIVYLQSAPEDCKRIRASFYGNRRFENFLFGYTRRAVAQLRSTGQDTWLWRGLVSLSLENSGIDYRDTLVGLAELYVNAEIQGILPKPYLEKVASVSSREKPRGGAIPMYHMMMGFDKYAILKERRQMAVGYWDK